MATGRPRRSMFEGHTDPWLVALSVAIAILGGYIPASRWRRACARRVRRRTPRVAGGRGGLSRGRHLDHAFRRHAGGAVTGRYGLSGAAHHHLVPDLRAGGRGVAVFLSASASRPCRAWHPRPCCSGSASSPACTMPAFMASPETSPSNMTGRWCCCRSWWRSARPYGGLRVFLARQDGIRLILQSFDRLRHRRVRHALHRDGRHAFLCRCRAAAHHHLGGGLAASPQILSVDRRGCAVLRDRRERLPAVAGAGIRAGRPAAAPAIAASLLPRRRDSQCRCLTLTMLPRPRRG